jgi:hypothetical protein
MSKIHSALESIVRREIPDNTDLWPQIAARVEQKDTVNMNPKLKLSGTVVLVILILLLLTGVAYAVGIKLGYIPGIGVVDVGNQLRVLAEPVSQMRDGITITITQAVSSADKTVIVFKVEGLRTDQYSPLEPLNTCTATDELRLSNGESVQISEGTSSVSEKGFESSETFMPASKGLNQATLFIPCIQGALVPGTLPEKWELPLRFVPAPPEMTVVPVSVVTMPSSAPSPEMTTAPDANLTPVPTPKFGTSIAPQNPFSIAKVIDIGDSYILIVDFKLPAPSQTTEWYSRNNFEDNLSDGNGQEVRYEPDQFLVQSLAGAELPISNDPHEEFLLYKIAKGFVPPLYLHWSYQSEYAANSVAPYIFEFNAGANPRPGQEWKLDKKFQWAGHTIHLIKVTAIQNGYSFSFGPEEALVAGYSVGIEGYTVDPSAGFGGGGGDADDGHNLTLIYSKMPKGKLKIVLSRLILKGETKDWTLNWIPTDSFPTNLSTPTVTP